MGRREETMYEALRAGRLLVGFSNTLAAEGLIETACADVDFVWIDAQHGFHSPATVREAVREADLMNIYSVVRVPGHEAGLIGPYLDSGVSAVIVPMVSTADQARGIVEAVRFPPRGHRSFGGRRACDVLGPDYHRNAEPFVIAQIETKAGVDNAADIIALNGIDMLFLGNVDLAIDMDLPRSEWNLARAETGKRVLEQLTQAAATHGKYSGCVAGSRESMRVGMEAGARFFSGGDDVGFLREAVSDWLAAANEVRGAQGDGTGR